MPWARATRSPSGPKDNFVDLEVPIQASSYSRTVLTTANQGSINTIAHLVPDLRRGSVVVSGPHLTLFQRSV